MQRLLTLPATDEPTALEGDGPEPVAVYRPRDVHQSEASMTARLIHLVRLERGCTNSA